MLRKSPVQRAKEAHEGCEDPFPMQCTVVFRLCCQGIGVQEMRNRDDLEGWAMLIPHVLSSKGCFFYLFHAYIFLVSWMDLFFYLFINLFNALIILAAEEYSPYFAYGETISPKCTFFISWSRQKSVILGLGIQLSSAVLAWQTWDPEIPSTEKKKPNKQERKSVIHISFSAKPNYCTYSHAVWEDRQPAWSWITISWKNEWWPTRLIFAKNHLC